MDSFVLELNPQNCTINVSERYPGINQLDSSSTSDMVEMTSDIDLSILDTSVTSKEFYNSPKYNPY